MEKYRSYIFPNGSVMTFDENGKQVPELQGTIDEVGERLTAMGVIPRSSAWLKYSLDGGSENVR